MDDAPLAGRYRRVRELGRGAMGTVWLADDQVLARQVAIKRLLPAGEDDPTMVERIMREARVAAALHHPHSVVIYDRVLSGTTPFVVMEYVPGRTLAELIADEGRLDLAAAASIGADVAAALSAAHRIGITHRDVKPGNVLVRDDGQAKLSDFGIARLDGDPALTATGQMIGTVAYMAPEVASDGLDSPASDVWSLGATLYAGVEGHAPFATPGANPSITAMLVRLVNNPVPVPTRAGPLAPVLASLLAKDPDRRPSASQARDALAAIARDLAGGSTPEAQVPRELRPAGPDPDATVRRDLMPTPRATDADADADADAATIDRSVSPSPGASGPEPRDEVSGASDASVGTPPRRRRRWLVGALAAVVVLAVAVGLVVHGSRGNGDDTRAGTSSASATTESANVVSRGLPAHAATLVDRLHSPDTQFGFCEDYTSDPVPVLVVDCRARETELRIVDLVDTARADYLMWFDADLPGLTASTDCVAAGASGRRSVWKTASTGGQVFCIDEVDLAWTYDDAPDVVYVLGPLANVPVTVTRASLVRGWQELR